MHLPIIYLVYVYKDNLALNNLQWVITHKIQPNRTKQLSPTSADSNKHFQLKFMFGVHIQQNSKKS